MRLFAANDCQEARPPPPVRRMHALAHRATNIGSVHFPRRFAQQVQFTDRVRLARQYAIGSVQIFNVARSHMSPVSLIYL
jgi:hypothetical protein